MHTVDRLERAIATAEQIGLSVRREFLNGVNGGICEVAGKKWIFIDFSLPLEEQLAVVKDAIRSVTATPTETTLWDL